MFNEIAIVSGSMAVAIALAISIFAGNEKEKLTLKMTFLMIAVGIVSGVITWSYILPGAPTKLIVRSVLSITFTATTLSKLISRIIAAATTISRDRLQQLMIDYTRKKFGLDKEEKTEENADN